MISRKNHKRNRISESGNHEGSWAVSYVDMLTVVLCFFIVFFNTDKLKVSKSLRSLQQLKADIGGTTALDCKGNGGAQKEGCAGTKGNIPGTIAMTSAGGIPGMGGGMAGSGNGMGNGTGMGGTANAKNRAPASSPMGTVITNAIQNFMSSRGQGSGGGTGNGTGPGAGSHEGEGASGYGAGTAGGVTTGNELRDIVGKIKLDKKLVNQSAVKDTSLEINFENVSFFESGSTQLTAEGRKSLQHVLGVLVPYKGKVRIAVQGHTDSRAVVFSKKNATDNWELSVKRATSVLRLFRDQGFPSNLLSAEGFADTRTERDIAAVAPVTEAELAKQRRITLRVEELNND